MNVLGAVLVGGASSRFGSDKSLARFGDRNMLGAICNTLIAADLRALVYVGGTARVGLPSVFEHVPDDIVELEGPERSSLLGVLAALTHAHATRLDAAVVLGCDVPLVTTDTIRRLIASLEESDIAVAEHEGRHWSIMALRTEVIGHVRASYLAGERAVHRVAEALRVTEVPCSQTECANVNDVATLRNITYMHAGGV